MSAYDLISKLEKLDYFSELLTHGLVPINWLDYKVIYEFYLNELEKFRVDGKVSAKNKRQAKENTAEEYGVSEVQVYRIIQKMKA